MATYASKFITGQYVTATSPAAGQPVVNDYFIDVTAGQLLLNDQFDIGILPANHTITDAILIVDDLDSNGTPLITLDAGLLTGTPGDTVSARACGNQLFFADQGARTGTSGVRPAKLQAFTILPSEVDRSIGVKVTAAPATAQAGRIRLRLTMHAADHRLQF
ncbi:MAG: hypothetical protein K0S54_1125 [Alphaproteobacteria bacterium]|jgi:hypothetical protein|nr:hypothetical protein [Alphaproteobacteria bacterium]